MPIYRKPRKIKRPAQGRPHRWRVVAQEPAHRGPQEMTRIQLAKKRPGLFDRFRVLRGQVIEFVHL